MYENFTQLDFLRIFAFILFSARIIHIDLKEKKIYNRDLLFMGVSGLVLFLMGRQFDLIPSLAINFFLGLALGVILWKIGIWSAGDGKLFVACTLYLPYKMYLPFFFSQTIVVNVFILAFLFWLLPVIFKTTASEKLKAFKISFEPKNILNIFLISLGLFYFIGKLVYLVNFGLHANGYFVSLAIALLAFGILQKIFQSKTTYVFLIFAVARVFFDTSFLSFTGGLIIALTVFALLFAGFLGNLSMYISYTEKKLPELSEGDVPIGARLEKCKICDFDILLKKKFKNMDVILRNGFGKDDLGVARKIKTVDGFVIKKTVSFAPLLFISALFVFFFGTDVLLYIISTIYEWFYE